MSAQSGQAGVSAHTPFAIAARQRDLVTIEQFIGAQGCRARRSMTGSHGASWHSPAPRGLFARRCAALDLRPKAASRGPRVRARRRAVRRLSAAQFYGCSRFPAPLIEVVSPRRRKVAGARVHHCRTLNRARSHRPSGHPDHDGAPDVRGPRRRPHAAPVGERHPRRPRTAGATSRPRSATSWRGSNGRHNRAALERAMELHRMGSAGTKSGAEDAFLRFAPAGAACEHAPARP